MTPAEQSLAFASAYHQLTLLIAATPPLIQFAGWPMALPAEKPAPRKIPAADLLKSWADGHTGVTLSLRDAVRGITDYADWQQTYTEEEVGAEFLSRYGYFELVGPSGHFQSNEVRAFVAYWGENLYYPWHQHKAEELYYIIAGEALFEAEGMPPQTLRAGDTRLHTSNQPHAMTTAGSPVLALVLWRGAGLTGLPRMSAEP